MLTSKYRQVQDDQESDKPIRSVKELMIKLSDLKLVQSLFVINIIFDTRKINEISIFSVDEERMHENQSLLFYLRAIHV